METKFVFLDPPYERDLEYLKLSEFWGTWFGMKFNFSGEDKFKISNINEYSKSLQKVLIKIDVGAKCVDTLFVVSSAKIEKYITEIKNRLSLSGFVSLPDSTNVIYTSPNSPKKFALNWAKYRSEPVKSCLLYTSDAATILRV